MFFKICLVGYLNNITSDRRLIEYCRDSLAIRLYLKYDIDESLPRHSTIGQLSVDTSHHIITGACADYANKRDCQCLEKLCEQTIENLRENDLDLDELLAETGYSSGEALQYLDTKNIDAWIPNFGQFTPEREGFTYNKEQNQYECQRGNRFLPQ